MHLSDITQQKVGHGSPEFDNTRIRMGKRIDSYVSGLPAANLTLKKDISLFRWVNHLKIAYVYIYIIYIIYIYIYYIYIFIYLNIDIIE